MIGSRLKMEITCTEAFLSTVSIEAWPDAATMACMVTPIR